MTDDLRVALIGYGFGGRVFHAPFLTTTPGLRLAAVVTSDPGRAAAAAAAHPHAQVLAAPEQVWADADGYDLVVVTTANVAHVPLARAALQHGLHVLVDKPLAPDAATAAELFDDAAAAGRHLVVYQNRRFDSDFLTLRRLVADGTLGDVVRAESRFERWRPVTRGGWRESRDPADMPGLLYDIGAHLVDQALVLLGPAATVHADVRAIRDPGGADDHAFVTITHASGSVSHLSATVLAASPGPRWRVLGTRGAYVVRDLDTQEAALAAGVAPDAAPSGPDDPGAWGVVTDVDGVAAPVRPEPGRWGDFYRAVAAAVAGSGPPPVSRDEAVACLAVMDAARESGRTGEIVRLP